MSVDPVFLGVDAGAAIIPYRVTLGNTGPNTSGVVTARRGSYRMAYPVQLPTSSTKRFVAYLPGTGYDDVTWTFDGDREFIELPHPSAGYGGGGSILVVAVTDSPGQLSFIRQLGEAGAGVSARDVYCKPGDMPDRACGFDAVSLVVLGDGAERMSDAEVRALQNWVMRGGAVLLFGGASAPTLADLRWRRLLPVSDVRPRLSRAPRPFERFGTAGLPEGPVSCIEYRLAPGARGLPDGAGGVSFVVRPSGWGRCSFVRTICSIRP
jgi:hypothetical protein